MRRSARLVVVDERQHLLLFRYEDAVALDPTRPDLTVYWATVGGGLEEGESFEQAARRELWEETGLRADHIGPWLWTGERPLQFAGEVFLVHERFYLVRVRDAQVSVANLLPYEQQSYRDHRWWALADLRRTAEVILPDGLADLLAPVLDGRLPHLPVTIR